jgi:hypothetical protein
MLPFCRPQSWAADSHFAALLYAFLEYASGEGPRLGRFLAEG